MSKGKYSPALTRFDIARPWESYCYNADKLLAPDYDNSSGIAYEERIHFGNYDENGYDSYGYSAFLNDGTFVGLGMGIDRWGYTEMDYLTMSDDEFYNIGYCGA